jgi:hypothetical protein
MSKRKNPGYANRLDRFMDKAWAKTRRYDTHEIRQITAYQARREAVRRIIELEAAAQV